MRNERGLRASYKVMSWFGRLALPLALTCVLVLIGLWIAEQVRLTREERAAADATAQSGAGSTAALQQPLQVLRLPPDVRPDTVSLSPTGARRQLGGAQAGQRQSSEDGAWLAGFDGDDHVIAIPTAGGDTRTFAQARSGALGALGWDGQRRIVVASYAAPFALQRVALDGTVSTTPLAGVRGIANARWSPDHRAALITASDDRGERTRVLTHVLTDLPVGALETWAGPHELLARG